MPADNGQRYVDIDPQAQIMSSMTLGMSGYGAFLIEYKKHDWKQIRNLDQRLDDLQSAQGEIQEAGRSVAPKFREEYLSSVRSLGEHQNARPLPNDLDRWFTPGVKSTLTEAELADHNAWSVIRSSLRTIDHNNDLKLPDATKLNDTAFHAVRGYGRMPSLTELRFPEGRAVAPEGARYNQLVGQFNEEINGMKAEHEAFKQIDRPQLIKAGVATFSAIALDQVLDYTLMRDRTARWSALTDLASPVLSALLVRKFGPAPAFIGPVLTHVAEKYLLEKPTDSQGKVI
jgi:hypothetical protein